ncbi:hypothetical protein CLAIMM_11741 [Cladophialophora immunda]|nr:hypothetical protein CLAIMM_11741 [Cladophialophora immunda]
MKLLALHKIEHSYGTVQPIPDRQQLQHKNGTSIVLVPQPTRNDPNDPLNWLLSKRVTPFWSVLWLSALCNFYITGLVPGFGPPIEEFDISLTQVTWLISTCLLGESLRCYTIAPFSTRYDSLPHGPFTWGFPWPMGNLVLSKRCLVGLSLSIYVTCVVVLINLIPVSLRAAPYNFSISQQGLVFLSPCIGNLVGFFFCGYINAKLSQWSTRRNGGVFEPEMRLPVVVIPALLVPAALLMFGIGVAHEVHCIASVIGAGLVGVATFNGFKNFVSFAVGFAVVP